MPYHIDTIISTDDIIIKQLKYEDVPPSTLNLSIFKSEERLRYESFISDKRRREYYFTRVLLRSFGIPIDIYYRATGKPLINNGHISISHSRNTVIIGYSQNHYLGIDIEYYNPKIFRIQNKFLNDQEVEEFDVKDISILTLIWSIKEAIYKMEDIPGLLFKEHIIVTEIDGKGKVQVIKNGLQHHYSFEYMILDNYVITYCYLLN